MKRTGRNPTEDHQRGSTGFGMTPAPMDEALVTALRVTAKPNGDGGAGRTLGA